MFLKLLLYALLAGCIFLLLPLFFKKRGHRKLDGPKLSEIDYSEISFYNEIENIKLAGLMMLPKATEPFPVAVIIHGSGSSRRDNPWYLSVAKYLQDNGIAVILPDKRGCEKSEGNWVGVDYETLAYDTIGAIEFIKNQNRFSYSYIGIIGMSQGGWIAPIVATKTPDVSFVVSMVGPSVTTDEQLLHEEENNISAYTYKFIAKLIAPITSNNLKKRKHLSACMGFNPIPFWKQINVPVFFAFGEDDKNVPVLACIERLKNSDLNRFKIKTYLQGGHAIRDVEKNKVSEDYLSDLLVFIKKVRL